MAHMDSRALRRITISILVFAASLLPIAAASAAPVLVEFAFPFSYMNLEYGPGLGFARVQDGSFFGDSSDTLDGPNGSFQLSGGDFDLTSGALTNVVPDGSDAAYIHDGGGSLSIAFDLHLADSSIHSGTFAAPLGAFTVDGSSVFGDLGPGLFDASTAALLGIHPQTLPGPFLLYLDLYSSYPDEDRVSKMFGYMDIAAEVPEPASLGLIIAGVSAAWYRRRRVS